MTQRPRNRKDNAYKRDDDAKDDCTERMVRQGVENFCACEDVETDEEGVVGEQHKPGKLVCQPTLAKRVVSKVADVLDLGVFHDILDSTALLAAPVRYVASSYLVHGHGGDPEKNSRDDHGDYAWHPTEDRERPVVVERGGQLL